MSGATRAPRRWRDDRAECHADGRSRPREIRLSQPVGCESYDARAPGWRVAATFAVRSYPGVPTERDAALATVTRSPQAKEGSTHANDHDRSSGRGRRDLGQSHAPADADVQSDIQVPLAGHLTVELADGSEQTALAQQRLTRKAWRLARKLAHERDEGFSPVPTGAASPMILRRRSRAGSRRCARASSASERRDRNGRRPRSRSRLGLPHAGGDRGLRVRRQPGRPTPATGSTASTSSR